MKLWIIIKQIVTDFMLFFNLLRVMKEQKDFNHLNLCKMKERKKSDTVFILGSGASINDLSETDWDYVFEHDTISFNFFLIHPILSLNKFPTYHFMEFPLKGRECQLDLLADVLRERSDLFVKHETPFIPRFRRFRESGLGPEYFPSLIRSNIYLTLTHLFHVSNVRVIKMLLKVLDLLWKLTGRLELSPFIYHAGSISYTTMFAYLLGYKKIILLGVDLSNPNYFWDEGHFRFYEECRAMRSAIFKGYEKHVTVDEKTLNLWGQMPVDKFLYCVNETVLQPNGVQILVGTKNSLLSERFAEFSFQVRS